MEGGTIYSWKVMTSFDVRIIYLFVYFSPWRVFHTKHEMWAEHFLELCLLVYYNIMLAFLLQLVGFVWTSLYMQLYAKPETILPNLSWIILLNVNAYRIKDILFFYCILFLGKAPTKGTKKNVWSTLWLLFSIVSFSYSCFRNVSIIGNLSPLSWSLIMLKKIAGSKVRTADS